MPSGIFQERGERINLLTPLFFLPLLIVEAFITGPFGFGTRVFLINLVEAGLGSAGHNGLGWAFLTVTPEGRSWLKARGGGKRLLRYAGAALLIFSVAATVFLFFFERDSLALKIFLLADWFLIHHHSLSQTQGLSFLYTYAASSQPKSAAAPVHGRQKFAFRVLLALGMIPAVQFILEVPVIETLAQKFAYAAAAAATVIWIMVLNRGLEGSQRGKNLFLARLFYFPLTAFWFSAAIAFRFCHGIEYLLMYRQMVGRSKTALTRARIAAVSIFFFAAAVFLWTFSIESATGMGKALDAGFPWWLKLMAALSVTRLYMHYYLDRELFRMRDRATREHIAPLIEPVNNRYLYPAPVRLEHRYSEDPRSAAELRA